MKIAQNELISISEATERILSLDEKGWLTAQQILDGKFYIKAITKDGIVIDSKCLKKPCTIKL